MGEQTVLAGRYRLERLIGAGSFSEVWRAIDLQTDDVVAVKAARQLLLGPPRDDDSLADLVHEAKILQRIEHPSIVRIRDTGTDGDRAFVVMDFLDGPSLRGLLSENGPLDETFAVEVARQIASALDTVHAAGIVHNDVKPENIILVDGRPFLADFGVARDLRTTLLPRQASELAGTLAYIAPEILEGEQPGPTADLYALAVTLYESVSGRTPFAGTTALRAAAGLDRQPLSLRDIAPTTSLHLDRFLARALDAIPARRFRTAAEFHNALPGVGQPTVRFTRLGRPQAADAVPAGRIVAMLPKVVAGVGISAVLFAGAMLLTGGGIFAGDGQPGDDNSASALPTPTATPPPPEPTPTVTPSPEPTEAPQLVEEPDTSPGPIEGFFSNLGNGLGEGVAAARHGLGQVVGDLGDAAGGLRDRFGN